MKIIIALCLTLAVAVTLAADESFSSILKSPVATLKLYGEFKSKEHLQYNLAEDRVRFTLFRQNAEMVARWNEDVEETATFGINLFSSMTVGEKHSYLGLNATGHLPHTDVEQPLQLAYVPSSKLWVKEGAVTPVKNQGGCGSCWAFGAVGSLETRYQQLAGKLRNFADQEYLDCVYEGVKDKDGCTGGWPNKCYEYSKSRGGRLASTAKYPYKGKDGRCKSKNKHNAAIAYRISGFTEVAASEFANIAALATGSIWMAFEVTDKFFQYQGGIIKDTTCTGVPNHAVTGVGYTPNYVLVKNSWGTGWGDKGFVKFARNYDNCHLFEHSSYPKLKSTGKSDKRPNDAATDYVPDDGVEPQPGPDCKDADPNCVTGICLFEHFAEKYCAKTCDRCQSVCPGGTVECSDGVCRHEHMCH